MYIITFYSFKGGVGRTMALVNVAAELVRRGRKVLVVDFDLEAPGLETYKQLQPPKPHPGIVEYVTSFRQTYQVPNLLDYIYETKPIGKKGGRLWVMPAGRRDRAYRTALANLDWQRLYKDQEGFLLFEDTKKGWEVELKPDYVLIDSRTGDTDVLGICTRQLPDSVVLMFTPNEQNLAGLKNVCRDIRREETEGLKKRITLHFVASNVPDLDDEDHHLRRHLNRFRATLNIPAKSPLPIIPRNETLQLLDQPIFALERPHSRLAREYRSLAHIVQIENREDRDGVILFLRELQKKKSRFLDVEEYRVGFSKRHMSPEVGRPINQISLQFWNDPKVLLRVGRYLLQHKEPGMALTRLNRVLSLQPNFGDALLQRAFCHRRLRNSTAAANDLFHFLRDHGNDQRKNATAILELLAISLDEFLKTLDLPPVKVPMKPTYMPNWSGRRRGEDSHEGGWLLCEISLRLIQQQRWKDAVRFLEYPKVRESIELGNQFVPTWNPLYTFHLAMAQWGKSGVPAKEECLHALRAFEPILDYEFYSPPEDYHYDESVDDPYVFLRFYGSWFQDLSLLYWGVGDIQKSENALNKALALLGEKGNLDFDLGLSSWTFQNTTVSEYRNDCEEMRRMIRGEPIRPAFIGMAQRTDLQAFHPSETIS